MRCQSFQNHYFNFDALNSVLWAKQAQNFSFSLSTEYSEVGLLSILLVCIIFNQIIIWPNYRGADKSLARPGRKQSTATKL